MKRVLALALVLALAIPALAATHTNEVLVLASAATRVDTDTLRNRRALEIQNLGPNSIFCAIGASADAVVNKSRKIGAGEAWALDLSAGFPVYCKAATADQVTGAATVVTEVR
jgi:predicted secreted protein